MKKVISIVIGLALVGLLGTAVYAKSEKAQGPHEKATGSIEILREEGKKAYAEFNAHETEPAKGEYH